MPITVFVVHEHTLMRDTLCELLSTQPDFAIVGRADCTHYFMRNPGGVSADVVILHGRLPGVETVQTIRSIRQVSPTSRIIILSWYGEPHRIAEALRGGAAGYVLSDRAGTDLLDAIRAVAAGEQFISCHVAKTRL